MKVIILSWAWRFQFTWLTTRLTQQKIDTLVYHIRGLKTNTYYNPKVTMWLVAFVQDEARKKYIFMSDHFFSKV